MTYRYSRLLLLLTLCAPILVLGGEKPNVNSRDIPGVIKVDAEGLVQLVLQLPRLVVIDARIGSDRNQGYIEESISLPNIDTNCDSLKKIAADRSTPVLFYCNGPRCLRSGKSAQKASDCGYKRLYWFYGGIEEWRAKGYPTVKDH